MKRETLILCENLVKIYQIDPGGGRAKGFVEVQALQGLDFSVARGEIVGVVGASGSGKSTLLNILGGLDRPTGGRAVVMGKDLGTLNQRELDRYRTRTVGFVWQYGARNLIPYLTALENIQLPMLMAGVSGKKYRQRAEELLELVGLTDRKEHRLEELSGGEQQRVAVAIALANEPVLLLADEPTGELDTVTAKTIYDLFQSLNRQLGLTVVIVSHDSTIAKHVDRVVAVRDGKLASETLRIPRSKKDSDAQGGESHAFEELLILDSAGRVSIPREYLDRFGFRRHVRVEVTEDGIHLRPQHGMDPEGEHVPQTAVTLPGEGDSIKELPTGHKKFPKAIQKLFSAFEPLKGSINRKNGGKND
jgi:ABC-type lipoprotein export system ATPase subunit